MRSSAYTYSLIIMLTILASLFSSCHQADENSKTKTSHPETTKNPLIKANRHLLETEEASIEDFINRYKWKMQKTPSGLRYMVYQKGSGKMVQNGEMVRIHYHVGFLNGKLCYSSDQDGPKEFLVGAAQVEKGLEEGILLLSVGDRAKFILPSHLAFGLLGDQRKIPARSVLVYDLEVVSSIIP